MCLDSKAGLEGVGGSIGGYFRPVEIEFLAPDESCLLALLHNPLKEAAKHVHAVPSANACQTGMIWQGLVQIIANIPTDAEPVSSVPHELPFRTETLEKHDQLELEKYDGI